MSGTTISNDEDIATNQYKNLINDCLKRSGSGSGSNSAVQLSLQTLDDGFTLAIGLPLSLVQLVIDYIFAASDFDFDTNHPEVRRLFYQFMRSVLIDLMGGDDNHLVNEFDMNPCLADALYESMHHLTDHSHGFHTHDMFQHTCVLFSIVCEHYRLLNFLFSENSYTIDDFQTLITSPERQDTISQFMTCIMPFENQTWQIFATMF